MVGKDTTLMADEYADRFTFSRSGHVHAVHCGEQDDLQSMPFWTFPPMAGHKKPETVFRRMVQSNAPASPDLPVAIYARTVMNL